MPLAAFGLALSVAVDASADAELGPLVDARHDEAIALATDLFDYAELGYLETKSAERLAGYLGANGFSVQRGRSRHPHGVHS